MIKTFYPDIKIDHINILTALLATPSSQIIISSTNRKSNTSRLANLTPIIITGYRL